jgi:adenosylcobinamide kinase / adenosylcobinamide-phosphate guanylyltransferase
MTMGRLSLVLGGARSGKSSHAQRLARALPGPVLFIATAQALDAEMRGRITAHRNQRPQEWETLELPTEVGRYMLDHPQPRGVVVLDCLTLLISNSMLRAAPENAEPDSGAAWAAVQQEVQLLSEAIRRSPSEWIVVSNEVGQGVVPAYATGRIFQDLLGWANQEMARLAEDVIWMVAGIPVPIGQNRFIGSTWAPDD